MNRKALPRLWRSHCPVMEGALGRCGAAMLSDYDGRDRYWVNTDGCDLTQPAAFSRDWKLPQQTARTHNLKTLARYERNTSKLASAHVLIKTGVCWGSTQSTFCYTLRPKPAKATSMLSACLPVPAWNQVFVFSTLFPQSIKDLTRKGVPRCRSNWRVLVSEGLCALTNSWSPQACTVSAAGLGCYTARGVPRAAPSPCRLSPGRLLDGALAAHWELSSTCTVRGQLPSTPTELTSKTSLFPGGTLTATVRKEMKRHTHTTKLRYPTAGGSLRKRALYRSERPGMFKLFIGKKKSCNRVNTCRKTT